MIMEMKTLGDVSDLLGYMILSGPDIKSEYFPSQNIESVFHELEDGLKNIKKRIGEEGHSHLSGEAAMAKAMYESGNAKGGRYKLHDMSEYIRLRKYKENN